MKNYKEIWMDSCENCQWVKSHQDGCLECRSTSDLNSVSHYGICDEYTPMERFSYPGQINMDYSNRRNEKAIIYPNN